MICFIDCSTCKHERPLLNGWMCCCDAYPDGFPFRFNLNNLKERKICNPENGIGYEKREGIEE